MPEKIYIFDYDEAMVTPIEGDTVYVREDAFIEKVCEWLKDCATFTDMNGKKRINEEMYKAIVEDFKNYMKGE